MYVAAIINNVHEATAQHLIVRRPDDRKVLCFTAQLFWHPVSNFPNDRATPVKKYRPIMSRGLVLGR